MFYIPTDKEELKKQMDKIIEQNLDTGGEIRKIDYIYTIKLIEAWYSMLLEE